MNTYIYALKDPRDGEIYYVGKSNNPRSRLSSHMKDQTNEGKAAWIADLIALNLRPELVILENVNGDGWQTAERKWISKGRDCGWPLVNIQNGGEGATGKGPSFDFFEPFLNSQQWEIFDRLDTNQKWRICGLVAIEIMKHSWIGIKCYGGDPEKEYSRDNQLMAGLAKARQLVYTADKLCGA